MTSSWLSPATRTLPLPAPPKAREMPGVGGNTLRSDVETKVVFFRAHLKLKGRGVVQYRPWDHTGAQAGPRPSKAPPLWPSLSLSLSCTRGWLRGGWAWLEVGARTRRSAADVMERRLGLWLSARRE